AVSEHFKISVNDILGQSRKAPIAHARHVSVYVTRELTGDSWKHIGRQFGNRDHTSVMHSYQRITEMVRQDRELKVSIQRIIEQLHPQS
ncbi:MAG: chromosomal replication initiator protein DnaA, partial [Nitrospirae bacterium]|nr:chromosomal replication initiator protein DnaA [Fimbriimonadaceae bacterium]